MSPKIFWIYKFHVFTINANFLSFIKKLYILKAIEIVDIPNVVNLPFFKVFLLLFGCENFFFNFIKLY